ncbi:unnamed protein product [Calypogeia fissa]
MPRTRRIPSSDPDSKLSYIPPHLRGFKTPSKPNASPNQPTPPHLQVETQLPIQISPIRSNASQKESKKFSNHGMQAVVTPLSRKHRQCILFQPILGAKPANEDAFLSFLNKKVTKDTEAKKKAAAEKVFECSAAMFVQPLAAYAPQSPLEVQPIYASSSSPKPKATMQRQRQLAGLPSSVDV